MKKAPAAQGAQLRSLFFSYWTSVTLSRVLCLDAKDRSPDGAKRNPGAILQPVPGRFAQAELQFQVFSCDRGGDADDRGTEFGEREG
jgi:hypothetical protein